MLVTLSHCSEIGTLSVKQLRKVIGNRLSDLAPALTSGLSFYSENARYVEGSLEIIEINCISNSEYSMSYRYQWSIFNACLDISSEEYINDTVTFTLTEKGLMFEVIDNSRPSTADEL
ncbi:hypothetical protein [Serratia silvae]|uniref:Uncharacterized protein n=1 Tax=Serratia silvae TaxID=2824122 RepID=A0ABT0K9I2_9GAMM|nr:hypothetical protein [Serratia silvae]MCL1028432.1 hypothetical protein [Serratia silvae]